MIIDIAKFNITRNKLVWSMESELLMLKEEIREFWDAETTAERVDAYIDTQYVWIGTKIKASYNTMVLPDEVLTMVELSLGLMKDYLYDELGDKYHQIIASAEKIVCQANELKGKELDVNGKVIKDESYTKAIDATKRIALMIEEVTKPTNY